MYYIYAIQVSPTRLCIYIIIKLYCTYIVNYMYIYINYILWN